MRVLLVAGEFPPLQGGLGDFSRCLAEALAVQGCEVSVYAPGASAQGPPGAYTVLPLARDWGWRDAMRLTRIGRGYDVVNIQYQAAAYGMKLPIHLLPGRLFGQGVPVVTTFHDLRRPYLFPKAGRLRTALLAGMLRASSAAIVTNEEDAEEAACLAPGARLHLVRIGSNVRPAVPNAGARHRLRGVWRVPEDATLVSYFGFLNASKGAQDLVQALRRLRDSGEDVHLVFVGGLTGASDATNLAFAASIKQAIESLGLAGRVHYTGYLEPEGVSQALHASDICALPYRDGASYRRGSLMAALAHGMPIVTTQPAVPVAGLSGGESVRLVPPADPELLAQAIRDLANSYGERVRLSTSAMKLSLGFTWEAIAADTVAIYRQTARAPLGC